MMRIAAIETVPFRLPMHGTLRWGKHSQMSEAHHVLVRVYLDNGAMGSAEALPRPTIYGETIHSIEHIIANQFVPRVVGQPVDFAQNLAALHEIKNNQTARGAVDMALHDAVAQANGQTLAAHLGATRERVRVSYILGVGENDEMLEDAWRVYQQGVRVLKVKIGRNHHADLERIQLLKQFGDDLDIYVDANETMSADDAPQRLAELRELGVLYCEEPLPVEKVRERHALKVANKMALIGDDSCFSLRDLQREIALDTFDILNIKCARTGFTESQQMRALAVRNGNGIMVGSQASSKLGMSRHAIFAAHAAIEHPSELSFFLKMKHDIVATPIPIVDGYVAIADLADVTVDEDLLREHRL